MKRYRLKDLVTINRATLSEAEDPEFKFRYIDISSVSSRGSITIPAELTSFGDAPSRARRIAPAGATLVSTVRTYLKAVAQVPHHDDNLVFSTGFAVLEAGPAIDPDYLYFLCRGDAFVDQVVARSVGVSYPAVNASDVGDIVVSLPDVSVQRAVVAMLREQLSEMTAVEAHLERTRTLLEERSVLIRRHCLFGYSGGSTDKVYGTVADDRVWCRLGQVLTLQRGYDLPAEARSDGDVPVVGSGGRVGTHDFSVCRGPGVITGRYGSIGSVHWVEAGPYWPLNTTLFVSDYKNNDPRYLFHLLHEVPLDIDSEKAAVPGVNRNVLHRLMVPIVPSVPLQVRTAAAIDAALGDGQRTRDAIERQLALLAERRRVLIAEAVRGQLDAGSAV